MKIAIAGLGRMGAQIARKLSENGHDVIAHNRSKAPIDEAAKYGSYPAYEKSDVIGKFKGQQPVIWLMLPADIVSSELKKWLSLLPKQSILIDGGNSDFRTASEKSELVKNHGSEFLDIGTSGGIWGYKNGFCMMVGGEKKAYEKLTPILQTLANPAGGYCFFGNAGSGHYVKMVHNAIEYGMMESLAEGYRMLKEGPITGIDLESAARVWQSGSIVQSFLNELTLQAIAENPTMNGINGVVAESGETRWTLEAAKELKIPLPAIEASFKVRLNSQKGEVNLATKILAAMRNKFGGHSINPD